VSIVLKFGSLNLLEPSGPVKACNGVALPLTYSYISGTKTVLSKVLWMENRNALGISSVLVNLQLINFGNLGAY
jgi:hypothetical protein